MLINLIRLGFVIMAISVGHVYGNRYYEQAGAVGFPWWLGAMLGFAIAITLIAGEHAFRRYFTRTLAAFLVGLGAGLVFSLLILTTLRAVIQDQDLVDNLDVPLVLITTYLVTVMVLHNADRFRLVIPFVEFRNDRLDDGAAVVDLSALADRRLPCLIEDGVLDQHLLIPRAVLSTAEALADAEDPARRLRGRRALENLAALRRLRGSGLTIDTTDLPDSPALDDTVLALVRLHSARLVCSNDRLSDRARGEGLRVINPFALARSLQTTVQAGDVITVDIVKPGEEPDQGVGFLDDGSMVVVAEAGQAIGDGVTATIVRIHQTGNGRMVFARRNEAS